MQGVEGRAGVLVCDKRAGPTSHDVVATVRRLAGQRRVGHAGTLDPPATGVLVLALGRATRLLPFLPLEPKVYVARVRFGVATDTLDGTGQVTATAPAAQLDAERVRDGLARFVGAQEQVPPMVSAIKVGGERLYAKARRGEEVERVPRRITVHALELVSFEAGAQPQAELRVTCSAGTYVRSLAADLGAALGTVAHLEGLRRTAVGVFDISGAHDLGELTQLAAAGRLDEALLAPVQAMAGVAARRLTTDEAADVVHGRALGPTGTAGAVAAIGPDGALVAVLEDAGGRARPRLVLA